MRINQRALGTNRGEEVVDDLVLLDRHRVEEDLLERADAALLHEAAELGHRNPLILRGTTPSRNRRGSLARRVDSLTATSMASRRCAPSQKASCMPTHKATGSSSGYKQQPRNGAAAGPRVRALWSRGDAIEQASS